MAKVEEEMKYAGQFDIKIVNDYLGKAKIEVSQVIAEFIHEPLT
jgi:guanylate kinase